MNGFTVQKLIGRGTHGSVVLAKRHSDQNMYAVKQINLQTIAETDKQNQLTEIRILSSVYHPNVVQLYEAFVEHNTINMVLEYCPDGDLDQEIQKCISDRRFLAETRVWSVLIQLLLALRELHRQGVCHRDVKGQNVLRVGSIVKMSDFGLAACIDSGKTASGTLGTPYFMAPEVWQGTTYSSKCDIYSLGCLVYLMCQLRHPFGGRDMNQLKFNVMHQEYAPVHGYSHELSTLIDAMLRRDPSARPSAEDALAMPCVRSRLSTCPTTTSKQILPSQELQLKHFSCCIPTELQPQRNQAAGLQMAMNGHGAAPICSALYKRNGTLAEMAALQNQIALPVNHDSRQTQIELRNYSPATTPLVDLPALRKRYAPSYQTRAQGYTASAAIKATW